MRTNWTEGRELKYTVSRELCFGLEELTPRPDTPPDRTALRSIPDLDDLSLGLGTKTSRSGINLRVVRSGGVSGLGVSSSSLCDWLEAAPFE